MKRLTVLTAVVCATLFSAVFLVPIFAQESGGQQGPKEASAGFTVARFVLCAAIENREPVGATETFPASTEKVYAFLEATDIAEDTQAVFVWYHGDKEISSVTLSLKKGTKWRTYSSKKLAGLTGGWKVELKDQSGAAVKSVSFKVE
jgi:hypothetical protein